jgi:drug/metabolite transporter (DMT)-like permease
MRPRNWELPFCVTAFCLLWSSAFAITKIALADCPPLFLVASRCLIAGVAIFGIIASKHGRSRIKRRDLLILCVLGIANNTLYLGLNGIAVRSISAGLAAIIASANPILTTMVAATVLQERVTWRRVIGLILGLSGVIIIVESRIAGGIDDPVGIAFSLGALASLVTGTILFKKLDPAGGLLFGIAVQNLAGGAIAIPLALTFESISAVVPSIRLLIAMAYLALLVSVGAYALWFHLLRVCGTTTASAYHFLMPALGVMFGWLILGEHVELADLAGIAPVVLGIYLVTRSKPAVATPLQLSSG